MKTLTFEIFLSIIPLHFKHNNFKMIGAGVAQLARAADL